MTNDGPLASLAAGATVGTFTLLEELGAPGGLADGRPRVRTFKARGRGGRLAALKAHEPAGAHAARNESEALRCLDAPDFPALLDEGTEPVPWLALAWSPGKALAEVAAPGTLEPAAAASLLARVLAALAHAHSRGILHGDLRPANIVITTGGAVTLIDLGLSGRVGSDASSPGRVSGTPAYLPRERLSGHPPSPGGEVHSACAVVLEALAGVAALDAVRTGAQPSASLPSGVPPEFSALLDAALSPDLSARPRHAADALLRLLPALDSALVDLPRLRICAGLTPARPGEIAEPPLVGRDAILSQLVDLAVATRAGHGAMAALAGEAGLGKTRLLRDLERHATSLGVRVLVARCRERASAQSGVWRDALAPLAAELATASASDVAELATADARALGFACPEMLDLPYVRTLPDPPDLSPDLNKFRVFSAITALLRNWSRREPLLLLIDDAQWADDATVELTHYLQRNVVHGASTFGESHAGGALSIVLARRPPETDEGGLLERALADSARTGGHSEVLVPRLAPDHLRELLAGMLPGGPLPPSLSDLVAAEAGGSPQEAVDLVTGLHGDGLLRYGRGSWRLTGGEEGAGGRLADLLRRRVASLSEEAKRLLAAAAVLGPEFDASVATASAGLSHTAPAALEELARARLVAPSGRGRHALLHEQLRRFVLDDLEPEALAAQHARAAAALETSGTAGAAEIARHFLAAGDARAALRTLPLAAQECRLAGSTAEALSLLRELVALHDRLPREERVARVGEALSARQAAAEILLRSGRRGEAAEAFLDLLGACRRASSTEAEGRALIGLGMAANLAGAYEEGRQHLERALELGQTLSDETIALTARVYLVQNAYMQGRFDAGEEHEGPVLAGARRLSDRALKAEALRQVGLFQHFRGRSEEAIPLYREALQLLTSVGDRRNTGATLHNLGILHNTRGEYHVAMECYERSLAIFKELGLRLETASCLTNVGNVHLQQGAASEAERCYLEARALYAGRGDRRAEAENLSNLGDVDLTRGAYDRARDRHAEALAVHRDIGNRAGIAVASCNLAVSLLELGRLEQAKGHLEDALEVDRELDSPRELAYDLAASAHLHRLSGEEDLAATDLETARKLALSAGDRYHATILTNGLAHLHAEAGDKRAETEARQALLDATSLGAPEEEMSALLTLSRLVPVASARREHVARALELAARLENPAAQRRAWHAAALLRDEQGDLAGAVGAMDRATSLLDRLARRLGDAAPAFLGRRDVARFLTDMLALEAKAGPRADALMQRYHLLSTEELRGRARALLASGVVGLATADAAELRQLKAFHDVVTGADLLSTDGLLSAFVTRILDLVDAERGLLFLARGSSLECRVASARGGTPLAAAERDVPRQVVERILRERRGLVVEDVAADSRIDYRSSIADLRVKSLLAAPLLDGGDIAGVLYVDRRASTTTFTAEARGDFEATCLDLAGLLRTARRAEEREAEVRSLRERLRADGEVEGLPGLLGTSEAMRSLFATARIVAVSAESVLITGPSGSGKEVLARALHAQSSRSKAPFVALDCGAVPDTLAESVLFGHVKGAFTGADRDRAGLFEEASGGTLFLDEITNASRDVQARLLRVLQEREVRRVGGRGTIPVDVRVMAATNVDLEEEVKAGRFREDLYYRLNVIRLDMPPLRERPEDVPLLAEHFLRRAAERDGKPLEGFTPEALALLATHDWPGNVRELANCVARMAAFCTSGRVGADRVPERVREGARSGSLEMAAGNGGTSSAIAIVEALVAGSSDFWELVREPLRGRSMTKDRAREVIAEGLRRTRGSYKKTAEIFGLPPEEYSRFMDYLRFNELKLDFRPFRRTD